MIVKVAVRRHLLRVNPCEGKMLFSVYARYIPNRTRRDGSALVARMGTTPPEAPSMGPKKAGHTPDLLPSLDLDVPKPLKPGALPK
jgi:hypothetical protein